MPKAKTVHIKSFGCQMNVYDSNRMLNLLCDKGFAPEPDMEKADVVLINTCSIRDKSEHKMLSLLGSLAPLKASHPERVLGVCGCVAQRMGRSLLRRVPHLDLVFGPDQVDAVGELVGDALSNGRRQVRTGFDAMSRTYAQPTVIHSARPSEFLTVMKGCDHFCTYCIVPFVRGREKSRPIHEVITDVKEYVARGTKEVVFLGQNINTYGKGTKESLDQLVLQASKVEGLERIRYITSHPRDLNDTMIAQFGEVEKLCPSLHLPFQSGSNPVLKRMSRLYTRELYLEKIEKLRKARPDIALSTDVIVGFPGETEEDFERTLDVMREVGFAQAFMFKYSPRPGTRATAYEEQVPEPIKVERLKRLMDLAQPIMEDLSAAMVGKVVGVLVESLDKKGMRYTGRDAYGRLVHVENAGPACVGKILDVEITQGRGSNLRGFYVGAPRESRDFRDSRNRVEESLSVPVPNTAH